MFLGHRLQQVEHSMCKGVLVPNDVAWRPPALHVRIAFAGYLNGSEATRSSFIDIELELIHSLKIEQNASSTAINLKTIIILSPGGESGGFDVADRSVLKSYERQRGVIHLNWRHSTALGQGPLGDKGFQQSADFCDLPDEIPCKINRVG